MKRGPFSFSIPFTLDEALAIENEVSSIIIVQM